MSDVDAGIRVALTAVSECLLANAAEIRSMTGIAWTPDKVAGLLTTTAANLTELARGRTPR